MYSIDLEPRQPASWQRDVGDAAVLDAAAVGNRDVSTDGDRGRVFEKRQHGPAQRVRLQHGISVDHQHQLTRGDIDAGVERVRLATAILLSITTSAGSRIDR